MTTAKAAEAHADNLEHLARQEAQISDGFGLTTIGLVDDYTATLTPEAQEAALVELAHRLAAATDPETSTP